MPATVKYDLVFASPFGSYEFFAHPIRQLCGQMRITFFFVNDAWVHEFTAKIRSGEVEVGVFLDMTTEHAVPDDPYTVLARAVKKTGAYMIDDPDTTEAMSHKGHCHDALVRHGVPVPETILVDRKDLDGFKLTDDMLRRLGVPFVVKPARGYGGVGVIMDGRSEEDLRKSAEISPGSETLLLQRRLTMKDLDRHKGWFRMFHICGTVIACWWDPVSHDYHLVTPAQVEKHGLAPLHPIMKGIARVSKMKKFSSEICLDVDGSFYAVDYVNSAPDMNPKSFYENGVPDEVVRYIAWLLFSQALQKVKRGQGYFDLDLSEADAARLEAQPGIEP